MKKPRDFKTYSYSYNPKTKKRKKKLSLLVDLDTFFGIPSEMAIIIFNTNASHYEHLDPNMARALAKRLVEMAVYIEHNESKEKG